MAADETAKFAIELEDQSSSSAEDMASALEELQGKIDGDVRALREMNKALRNLKAGTSPNIQQMNELKERMAAQKATIASAQSQYIKLGGTFEKNRKPTGGFANSLNDLNQKTKDLPGPLGSLLGRLSSLSGLLSGGGISGGVLLLAAGVTALTAAVVAGTAALTAYTFAQSNARREEALRLEGLSKIRDWYGRPAGNAGEMQRSIDEVSNSVALGRGKIEQYNEQLYRMGLRGESLRQALRGVAVTAATQGDSEASLFMNLAAGAAYAGQSVKALSDDVDARLGGLARRQMLRLSVQTEKLGENLGRIFDGVNIEPVLEGFATVTGMFSQSEATGRAFKAMVNAIFGDLGDGAEESGFLVKRLFQGITIGALRLTVVFLKVRNGIRDAFGDFDLFQGIDKGRVALNLGVAAAALFGGAIALVVVSLGALATIGKVAWAGLLQLFRGLGAIRDKIAKDGWAGLGRAVLEGIVDGIRKGWTLLKNAMVGLASKAKGAFKSAMEIFSPSRAMSKLSVHVPGGVAMGVREGTPQVVSSIKDMAKAGKQTFRAEMPKLQTGTIIGVRQAENDNARKRSTALNATGDEQSSGPPRRAVQEDLPADASRRAASSPQRVNIERLIVEYHAAKGEGDEQSARRIAQMVIDLLEGAAIQAGAA